MQLIDTTVDLIKQIPGTKWLYRSLINSPGSWIYTDRNLKWLSDAGNYSQLPNCFKIYALYCQYVPKIKGKILGAEIFHLFLSSITRIFELKDHCSIKINSYIIFLSLIDPRSLVIPSEIINSSEIALLKHYLNKGDTFVDIGANHGSFSVVASKLVGSLGLVIAVEPQPKLANLIKQSLSANNSSKFEVYQVACSDSNGEETFYIPRSSSGSAGVFKEFSAISISDKITVTLKTFDDLVDSESFTGKAFFKLDVEGSEINFLQGASQIISKIHPHIMLEINPSSMRAANTQGKDLISLLHQLGYVEYIEVGDSKTLKLDSLDISRQRNILVVPNNLK